MTVLEGTSQTLLSSSPIPVPCPAPLAQVGGQTGGSSLAKLRSLSPPHHLHADTVTSKADRVYQQELITFSLDLHF